MKPLFPVLRIMYNSFDQRTLEDAEKQILKNKVFERDDFTCQYCDYKAENWQVLSHINGFLSDNREENLETVCQMCNLIINIGWGCVGTRIVQLYKKSNHDQNKIIQITRNMRNKGERDIKIIQRLGLSETCKFKMDARYLKGLFGFVTSRKDESVHINENK